MTESKGCPNLDTRLALRAREAAAALGISERKLRDLSPYLPTVRLGGVLLYPVEGVRKWLQTEATNQEAAADAVADQILKEF